jgi:hypothetical protein
VREIPFSQRLSVSGCQHALDLARHIDTITLFPDGKGSAVSYKRQWKVLGYRDGAEGQNRTAYAGLFRAALYR